MFQNHWINFLCFILTLKDTETSPGNDRQLYLRHINEKQRGRGRKRLWMCCPVKYNRKWYLWTKQIKALKQSEGPLKSLLLFCVVIRAQKFLCNHISICLISFLSPSPRKRHRKVNPHHLLTSLSSRLLVTASRQGRLGEIFFFVSDLLSLRQRGRFPEKQQGHKQKGQLMQQKRDRHDNNDRRLQADTKHQGNGATGSAHVEERYQVW